MKARIRHGLREKQPVSLGAVYVERKQVTHLDCLGEVEAAQTCGPFRLLLSGSLIALGVYPNMC